MEAPGQEVNHKRRISYQKNELHEPTNDQLSGYLNDRIEIIEINTDETEETNSESHQKGTFTCEKRWKNFKKKLSRIFEVDAELQNVKSYIVFET